MKQANIQKVIIAALLCALLSAVVCLLVVSFDSNQSIFAFPMPQAFEGEYSWDRETWTPLDERSDLCADQGDLYLRGHFSKPISAGMQLSYYGNHIGAQVWIDQQTCIKDCQIEIQEMGRSLMRSMCARTWKSVIMPEITPDSLVEIRLHNPHDYGNRHAYREFLDTLCVTDMSINMLPKSMEVYGKPYRIAGSVLMIAALMILGASVCAMAMRIEKGDLWFACGLMTLFMGAFVLFDTIDVCYWNELLVFNTYVWQISAMLALLCAHYCVYYSLTGRAKRLTGHALMLSAALDTALIVLSFAGENKIFDFLPVWACVQLALCLMMIVCCIRQMRSKKCADLLLPASGIAFFAAVAADLFGAGATIVSRANCSKVVFVVLFVVYMLKTGRFVVDQYVTSMRVDKMEKELEESRIAIMLSQIQPHFLYNSLSVIQELCHSEPMEAERAIGRFAEFLRGNMTALRSEKLIPFADELHHIRSYLEIEKLRFGDQLCIDYDIGDEAFSLPTLTLQPLVENAVRHGVRKNENGGTVSITVRGYADRHEIVIKDDGPGFSTQSPASGDTTHVGIENVKKRLERMCGGTLKIDSRPGMGTRVVVSIPKEGRIC